MRNAASDWRDVISLGCSYAALHCTPCVDSVKVTCINLVIAVNQRYCRFINQMATHLTLLFCKLVQLTRETKVTLTLNPKTKLTLERGSNRASEDSWAVRR